MQINQEQSSSQRLYQILKPENQFPISPPELLHDRRILRLTSKICSKLLPKLVYEELIMIQQNWLDIHARSPMYKIIEQLSAYKESLFQFNEKLVVKEKPKRV